MQVVSAASDCLAVCKSNDHEVWDLRLLFSEYVWRCELIKGLFFDWAEVCLVESEAWGAAPIAVRGVSAPAF